MLPLLGKTIMIAYIEGRLAETTLSSCVLVCSSGVGYEIYLPSHSLATLTERGKNYFFYICHVVREDADELFGFNTWDEREIFILLTSINRVGARTALAILSEFRPDDLRRIVWEQDEIALTRVSGIGKKTGQQIFIELSYKLKVSEMPRVQFTEQKSSVFRDTLTGLVNLGYNENEVSSVLKEVLTNDNELSVSEALRACLKILAQKK